MRILTMILAASLAAPAEAQFAYGELSGRITEPDGARLHRVAVTARHPPTGMERSATTSEDGTYTIAGLRPGTYIVTFELRGFTTAHHREVELRLGQATRLSATLERASIREAITVTADRPLINVRSKQIGATLTPDEFRDLPSQNRSFVLFAGLAPGVVPNPQTDSSSSDALSINGQHQANNSFRVDGARNDDPTVGSQGGAQVRTPIEAIQEFQILTSQFDAESGAATGGVLNAITKRGTNAISGSAFAFFQDARWDAKEYFTRLAGLPRTEASFRSFGLTVGGPILRDQLHYFISYEHTIDREGHTRSFASRPELSYSTTEDNEIRNVLVRGDYHIASSHHSSFRYLSEDAPQRNKVVGTRSAQEGTREEHDRDMNAIAGLESVSGEALFNSLLLSYTHEHFVNAPSPFGEWASDVERLRRLAPMLVRPSVQEGPDAFAQDQENESIEAADTVSGVLRRHVIRAGFQWARRSIRLIDFANANGRFDFDTDAPFDPAAANTYPVSFTVRMNGAASATVRNIDTLGLFAHDDWQARTNLTVSAGLRWDRDDGVADRDNFAPRLGFAWSPQRSGRTVIRGGAGRFYDQTRLGRWSLPARDAVRLIDGFEVRLPDAGSNRQFFYELGGANQLNTLVELRDFLVRMLEKTTAAQFNASPTVDHADRVQPYVDTVTIGAQREIGSNAALEVDLVHSESRDTLVLVDLNPFSRSAGGRPDISVLDGRIVRMGSISTMVNAGSGRYRAVQVSARRRMARGLGGRIAYTYADSEGTYGNAGPLGAPNTAYFQTRSETGYDFDTGEIIGEPLHLNLDDPRNDGQPVGWHRRHNVVVAGALLVPRTALSLSWIYRQMSGDRFTVFTSAQLDNGNRAPAPAADYGRGVRFSGTLFGAENPDFRRVDVRLGYTIPLRARSAALILSGDVFNATNRTNFVNAGNTFSGSSAFLKPTAAFSPRQFQFGARLSF